MPKLGILKAPWRPAGPKMVHRIIQMAPNCCKKALHGAHNSSSNNFWLQTFKFLMAIGTLRVPFGTKLGADWNQE